MKKRQNRRRSKKSNTWSWFSIIILVLAGAGALTYYFIVNKNSSSTSNSGSGDSNTENPDSDNSNNNINTGYVRPPIGAKFKTKTGNKDLVVNFSHFDSPGASKGEQTSTVSGQGAQEVNEAYNIDNALDWFKKELNSENIFFMGDTNIKVNNQAKAFNTKALSEKGYSFLFNDDKAHATSLGSALNTFANPYDKVIYSLKDFSINNSYNDISSYVKSSVSNGFILDTYKTYNESNSPQSWITHETMWDKTTNTKEQNLYNYIKYGVSDHVPVGLNIKDDSNNDIRLGFWNVLNFSFTNKAIIDKSNITSSSSTTQISEAKKNAHARNIADIVYKANYDLIGFVEINNGTPSTNLQFFLDYLNKKNSSSTTNNKQYSGFLTKPTNSPVASSGQIEQVAFIYNSNLLELDQLVYPRFYQSSDNAILDSKVFNNMVININNLNNVRTKKY